MIPKSETKRDQSTISLIIKGQNNHSFEENYGTVVTHPFTASFRIENLSTE